MDVHSADRARSFVELVELTAARKLPPHCAIYPQYFEPLRDARLRVLELGIDKGGSLELWARYFENATICGVDHNEPPQVSTDRIRTLKVRQDDAHALEAFSVSQAPDGWDVIIDDCSHQGALTLVSFRTLFPRLKVGGFYAVEDWATGYFPYWPDGQSFDASQHFTARPDGVCPSHAAGLVGFVKQIVDEVGLSAINSINGAVRPSFLEYAHISRGIVMMRKARACAAIDA